MALALSDLLTNWKMVFDQNHFFLSGHSSLVVNIIGFVEFCEKLTLKVEKKEETLSGSTMQLVSLFGGARKG